MQLGILFNVNAANLSEITLYAGYGNDHPLFDSAPQFTNSEADECLHHISRLWEQAQQFGDQTRTFHVVTFLKLPPTVLTRKPVRGKDFVLMPTVKIRRQEETVSALIVRVNASSEEQAKHAASKVNLHVAAMLTLLVGQKVSTFYVTWPRGSKAAPFVSSYDPLPENESLYPIKGLVPWAGIAGEWPLSEQLPTSTEMMDKLNEPAREAFTSAIWAYGAGVDILGTQPTLASVAFIASLSVLASRTQCKGTASCSECGISCKPTPKIATA